MTESTPSWAEAAMRRLSETGTSSTAIEHTEPISTDVEARVTETFNKLVEAFSDWDRLAPNEEAEFMSIARNIVMRETLQQRAALDSARGVVNEEMRKQVAALSRSIHDQQKALGIDPATRIKTQSTRRADEEIADLIAKTKAFRRDHIVHIQHCGVLLGFVCVHFPMHFPRTITVKCPRCLEEFEAQIVTDQAIELYTEAQWFAPEGAPLHMVPTAQQLEQIDTNPSG